MRFNKVYLEITDVCNLNCSFCHGTSRKKRFITLEEFDLLTDRLSGYTEYLYYHLMGEPLLHPLLSRMLETAKAKGYRSILTTNGTLLESRGEELLETGALHKVNISLQAYEGNGLEAPENYAENCADFALLAAQYGVICVFRLWNVNGQNSLNDRILAVLKRKFTSEWIADRSGFRLDNRVFLEYAGVFSWPDLGRDEISPNSYCYGLKDQLGVLCDGTVVPCCLDSDGIIKLGNLFSQDLEQILDSERTEAILNGFRNRHPSEELCRKCGYSRRFDK